MRLDLRISTVQSTFDGLFVPGLQWYWRADNFTGLSDAAIAKHVEHGSKLPTMLSTMHLYPVNGAAQRIGKHDTAYSFRKLCSPRSLSELTRTRPTQGKLQNGARTIMTLCIPTRPEVPTSTS